MLYEEDVVCDGYLHLKGKNPVGIKGFRMWEKRYFLLTTRCLRWFVSPPTSPQFIRTTCIADINLTEIAKAEYLPGKRVGCRFDLTLTRRPPLNLLQLHGSSIEDAKLWTKRLIKAVNKELARLKKVYGAFCCFIGPRKKFSAWPVSIAFQALDHQHLV